MVTAFSAPDGARAFAADLPDAEIHLLAGGHFLLESAGDEVAELIRVVFGQASELIVVQSGHEPVTTKGAQQKW